MKSTLIALLFLLTPSALGLQYEICTPENGYLEDKLPSVKPEPPSALPSICVMRAHLNLPPTGYYGFCPTTQGMPTRSHRRPCVSEKYVNAVHSALLDTAECFGYDLRWAFASFNLESALHINAVGAAGDVGVGQLTRIAIEQINNRALVPWRESARYSSLPACWRLGAFMKEHTGDPAQRCGFMNLPENPRRNLVYSILLLKQNRKLIERYFIRYGIKLPPAVDQERLINGLAKLAYNSGAAGLGATLAAYTQQMGQRLGAHHFHWENFEATSYVGYLGRHFPVREGRESVRKRVSRYMRFVIASVRRVDQQLGGGVCLDNTIFPPLGPHPMNDGPTPDPSEAHALINRYLLEMADEHVVAAKLANRPCAQIRNDFEFEFVPSGLTPEDLPAPLYERWKRLCR